MAETRDARMHTDTGSFCGHGDWLDVHFEAARPEYERSVGMAGFHPGWHLLDAGCGGGSFLPLLAERVDTDGRIAACDLDPSNVEAVRRRLADSPLTCPVDVQVGDVRSLPYPDDHFDAAWLASVLMYITDADLPGVLDELQRVVKPGGLVVAKEADGEMLRYLPVPMEYRTPFYAMDSVIPGMYRARYLRYWFDEAGFDDVSAQTILMERWQPLRPVEREYIHGLISGGVKMTERLEMSDEAKAWWQQQLDLESPDAILNRSDFAFLAGHVVTTGRVPSTDTARSAGGATTR